MMFSGDLLYIKEGKKASNDALLFYEWSEACVRLRALSSATLITRFNEAPTKVLTMNLRCFWETGPREIYNVLTDSNARVLEATLTSLS